MKRFPNRPICIDFSSLLQLIVLVFWLSYKMDHSQPSNHHSSQVGCCFHQTSCNYPSLVCTNCIAANSYMHTYNLQWHTSPEWLVEPKPFELLHRWRHTPLQMNINTALCLLGTYICCHNNLINARNHSCVYDLINTLKEWHLGKVLRRNSFWVTSENKCAALKHLKGVFTIFCCWN